MRILSLLPSTTEVIYALGIEDQLVGVTHECDWPREARTKPQVTSAKITPEMESSEIDRLVREQLEESGTLYALDMDLVRELKPDLVLTQQLCTVCAVGYETVRAAMATLENPPMVLNVEPRNLEEVFGSIADIAQRGGVRSRGEELVATLRQRLEQIGESERAEEAIPLQGYRVPERHSLRSGDRPRMLFLEWLIPPFSAGHWIPDLVIAAGFEPVLAHRGEHSRGLEWETIRDADFEVLVISCCGFSIKRALEDLRTSEELNDLLRERPEVACYVADGNHYFSRPGPRLVGSAEILGELLA